MNTFVVRASNGSHASIDLRESPQVVVVAYLGTILFASMLLRLAFLIGPIGSDDSNYFHFARYLLHWETLTEVHHHACRLIFLAIVGVPAVVFGSVYSGAIVNVALFSIRDIIIVYYVKRRYGEAAALSAAGVLTLNALSVTYAGLMIPDGLLSLMTFLSAMFALEAIHAAGGKRTWLLIGSGIAGWAAYSAKETGLLVLPCVMALLFASRFKSAHRSVKGFIIDAFAFCAAFAVFAALEMSVYYGLSGDPLYRFHAISLTHNTIGDVVEAASLYDFIRRIYWNFASVVDWRTASLPMLLCALVVWALCLFGRTRILFFPLTGAFLTIYLIFGTSSLSRLIPLPVQDRYFEVIIPFVAVCAGALVGLRPGPAKDGRKAWFAAIFVVALVGATSLPAIVMNGGAMELSSLGKNAATAITAVRRVEPDRPIYVSAKLKNVVEQFIEPDIYATLQLIPEKGPLPSGYFVLHPRADVPLKNEIVNEIANLPSYLRIEDDHRVFAPFLPRMNRVESVVRHHERSEGR